MIAASDLRCNRLFAPSDKLVRVIPKPMALHLKERDDE